MSRRRIAHGKAARQFVEGQTQQGVKFAYAVRGDVEKWRAQHGVEPHGLRPAAVHARSAAQSRSSVSPKT